jgi:hypothetical protein
MPSFTSRTTRDCWLPQPFLVRNRARQETATTFCGTAFAGSGFFGGSTLLGMFPLYRSQGQRAVSSFMETQGQGFANQGSVLAWVAVNHLPDDGLAGLKPWIFQHGHHSRIPLDAVERCREPTLEARQELVMANSWADLNQPASSGSAGSWEDGDCHSQEDVHHRKGQKFLGLSRSPIGSAAFTMITHQLWNSDRPITLPTIPTNPQRRRNSQKGALRSYQGRFPSSSAKLFDSRGLLYEVY